MCRRWSGAAFATLVWFERRGFRLTGAAPQLYRSSPIATRSHCSVCGTPVHLVYDGADELAVCIGTLDEPERVVPAYHYGAEARLPWVDIAAALPARTTRESW
jgi:hypothetical protein